MEDTLLSEPGSTTAMAKDKVPTRAKPRSVLDNMIFFCYLFFDVRTSNDLLHPAHGSFISRDAPRDLGFM